MWKFASKLIKFNVKENWENILWIVLTLQIIEFDQVQRVNLKGKNVGPRTFNWGTVQTNLSD